MLAAVFALVYLAVLCAVAVFHRAYRDNVLQQWGLVASFFGCLGLMTHVFQYDYITGPCAVLLIGMVSFATGTFIKVLHYSEGGKCNSMNEAKSDLKA